jgi:hypothetical protein
MSTLKRIIRYIHGTIDFGLHLYPSSVRKLVSYTDVDWLVVQTLGVPPLVIVFILATISSHGVSNANTHFLGQAQKPTLLQFVFLVTLTYATFIKNVTNIDDFVTFFKNCYIPHDQF